MSSQNKIKSQLAWVNSVATYFNFVIQMWSQYRGANQGDFPRFELFVELLLLVIDSVIIQHWCNKPEPEAIFITE